MAGSILDGLKAQRDALAVGLSNRLAVPEWGSKGSPTLVLRVKPVERSVILMAQKIVSEAGRRHRADAAEEAAAVIVSAAVTAVIVGGDVEVSLKEFGEHLELPDGASGSDVVREFCLKPGDADSLAQKITELSGFGAEIDVLDEEFAGE